MNDQDQNKVQIGSALSIPYHDETFDYVYSIGCLHHTGDLQQGINEVYRVLKPGGSTCIMIYNRNSLRQVSARFRRWKGSFFRQTKCENDERTLLSRYDSNEKRSIAPHIDFTSLREAKRMFRQFSRVRVDKQNADPVRLWTGQVIEREKLLTTIGRLMGLDLYICAKK